MDGVIEVAATVALLLLVGGAIGLAHREGFSPRWLLAAGGLVLLHDFLLSRGYGLLPHIIPPSECNWQG